MRYLRFPKQRVHNSHVIWQFSTSIRQSSYSKTRSVSTINGHKCMLSSSRSPDLPNSVSCEVKLYGFLLTAVSCVLSSIWGLSNRLSAWHALQLELPHSGEVPDSDSREPGVPSSHFLAECCDAHETLALLYKASGQALTTEWKYKVGFGCSRCSKLLQPSRTQIRGRRVLSYPLWVGLSAWAWRQLQGQPGSRWSYFRQYHM